MYILNYIYFIILTAIGYIWLTSKGGYMTNPLNRSQKMWLDGPERFWVLTFATGLFAFAAPGGVFNILSIRLFILEVFCIVGLFLTRHKAIWNTTIILYIIYLLWLCVGLIYTPAPSYGFRVILKYLYPLLIMLFASAVVRDVEVFLKASIAARTIALISIGVFFIPFVTILFPGVFWYGTASAINYIAMFVLSLALYYHTNEKRKNLALCVVFILPCILWVFRTSIMGTVMAAITFFFFKDKIRSIPFILGTVAILVAMVFLIPSIKEKMFYGDDNVSIAQLESGDLSIDDINTNGRLAVWEWSTERFFVGHEMLGSGTSNLQEVFYSLKHPFGTIKIVHNDYVQILCDNGIIGLILFGLCFIYLIVHCFVVYNNKGYAMGIRICAIVAGASAAGMLLTLYTDNVINYSMATLSYPCGFYGMMLGMIAKEKGR